MSAIGTEATVIHDIGVETGIIVGISREVVAGEGCCYTIRFQDGTRSSWHETLVTIR